MSDALLQVIRIGDDERDVERVVGVLCDSFAQYPVLRFVLSDAGADYDRRLRILVRYFAMARVLRGETILAVASGKELAAAALVSRLDAPTPAALEALREATWAQLGPGARARHEAYGAAMPLHAIAEPHLHLNMIGVRRTHRGTGLGRRLLEAVHRLSVEDPGSAGVSLTTENPANVPLYLHFGYTIVGHAQVAPELGSWGFFRPDYPSAIAPRNAAP